MEIARSKEYQRTSKVTPNTKRCSTRTYHRQRHGIFPTSKSDRETFKLNIFHGLRCNANSSDGRLKRRKYLRSSKATNVTNELKIFARSKKYRGSVYSLRNFDRNFTGTYIHGDSFRSSDEFVEDSRSNRGRKPTKRI